MKPTCEIVEYASMRLRFVCAIATTLPTPSTAPTARQHVAARRPRSRQAFRKHPHGERERRDLRRRADEQRHRRRRAVVHVRDPHVERHRAELECDADDDEGEPEQERRRWLVARRSAPPTSSSANCR